MSRLLRSALRAADHLVQGPSLKFRLKPLGQLFSGFHGSANALSGNALARSLMAQSSQGFLSNSMRSSQWLPTRFALNRPFRPANLPRVPVVARNISQVGLGTARNFSSGRQVFQNIVENVPISTRALWEAEWDLKEKKALQRRQMRQRDDSARNSPKKERLRMKENRSAGLPVASLVLEDTAIEYSTFFRPEAAPNMTTYLVIPLYPSPERLPLSAEDHPDFLQLSELQDVHAAHSLHSIRISSIFARLDAADVWSRGVDCNCYGGPSTGLITSLRVVFDGWTKEEVLNVIGEAGMGWCDVVEEFHRPASQEGVDVSNETFALVMPTLDFSSSFTSQRDAQGHSWNEAYSSNHSRPTYTPRPLDLPGDNTRDWWSVCGTQRFVGFSEDFLSHCDFSSPASSYYEL